MPAICPGPVFQWREAAEDVEADRVLLRRLIDTVKSIAFCGTGMAAGEGLVALAEQVAQSLLAVPGQDVGSSAGRLNEREPPSGMWLV